MEVKGSIHLVNETKQVSDKFKSREFVVKVEGTYPQFISMQCTQDKVVMLDGLAKGQNVDCKINLRGREWTSPAGEVKYFNTIECWKLDAVGDKIAEEPKDDGSGLPF